MTQENTLPPNPLMEVRNISKAFPGVQALDDVSVSFMPGEVHAVVGENGAGKSTLMKVMAGVYRADEGEVLLRGEKVTFAHPQKAQEEGVSIIYQELNLLPERTVAQNIFLGREPARFGLIDFRELNNKTMEVLKRLDSEDMISPTEILGTLSVAEQQIVEIAKSIAYDSDVLIMDEPTAPLSSNEVEILVRLIDRLKSRGMAIIFISHRLREVFDIADKITVLKDGELVDTVNTTDVNTNDVIRMMVGRELTQFYPPIAEKDDVGETILKIENGQNDFLKNINMELKAGEILGVAGLQGSGRTELSQALFGEVPFKNADITLKGEKITINSPAQAIKKNMGFVTEDRKAQGIFPNQPIRDNILVTIRALQNLWTRITQNGVRQNPDLVPTLGKQVDVRASGYDQEVQNLSGGNQQKVILAKWLAPDTEVLIFDEPTRGIDVDAKASIHTMIRDLAKNGAAIMMVSSELPEIIGMSDRILTMCDGEIAGILPAKSSEAEIMLLATGYENGEEPGPEKVEVQKEKIEIIEEEKPSTFQELRNKFAMLRIPPVYYMLIALFIVGLIADTIWGRGQMSDPTILMNILVRSVALGIVAIGQTMVMIGASIDLSVAYLISVTAVMSSYIMQGDPENVPLAVAVVFGIGALVGLINGLIITKFKVNAFIATLGMGLILRGGLSASFSNFTGAVPESFQTFGYGTWGPIPISVIILLLFVVLGTFILRRTKYGSHLYAVGGDEDVSRLSGLRTDRVIIISHIMCSLTAVLAGLFIVSRLRAGAPWIGTDGVYDLESIAAVVVGGTALSGGIGNITGSLAGVIIFGVLDTVFNQVGLDTFLKSVLRGIVIILAVASYTIRSKREAS